MKRIFFLAVLACLGFSFCQAQPKGVSSFISETNFTKIDTVVNATTKGQILKAVNSATILNLQVTATKISGTTAGVVRAFGSNDKVAWERLTATGTLSAADSLNLTNVSTPQTKFFKDSPSKYLWYRVTVTGTGTASTKFSTVAVGGQ
jgi:hypothetical protein